MAEGMVGCGWDEVVCVGDGEVKCVVACVRDGDRASTWVLEVWVMEMDRTETELFYIPALRSKGDQDQWLTV